MKHKHYKYTNTDSVVKTSATEDPADCVQFDHLGTLCPTHHFARAVQTVVQIQPKQSSV